MATNFKRDPAVIEHVNDQVGKASVKATKNETARVLKIVASFISANKAADHDKVTKNVVATNLKELVASIKNAEAVGGA